MGEEVGPESFELVMTLADLEGLSSIYFISGEFGLTLASTDDRICFSPVGSVGVYKEAMKAGLHFPLHPFIKRVLGRFCLCLA